MLLSVSALEETVPRTDPTTLGRYELLEEIGTGMMGVVYRARDPLLNRIVALKTVQTKCSMEAQERASFEQRFLVEARAAAALSHPGVVMVHDCGKDAEAGTLFIAFEYLEGVRLDQTFSSERPLDWRQALRLAQGLAEALDHAHQRGIVHRDIKPANIMVLPSGQPKIMDFGIAKLPTSAITLAGEILGTPCYMSPEQAVGEPADNRSDLFSLGLVLYSLLTGRRAFEGANLPAIVTHVVHSQPEPPSAVVPGLPPGIDALVAKALAKCPQERFQDAGAFRDAIDALLTEGPVSDAPSRARMTPPPSRGKTRRLGLLVAAVLAAPALITLRGAPQSAATTPTASAVPVATPPAAALQPVPQPTPTPTAKPVRVPAQGRLEISFEHSLKDGALQVFVDDRAVLTQPLDKGKGKKLLITRTAQGRPLAFPPGSHAVRVQVHAGKDSWSGVIRGTFRSEDTLRLRAKLGGLFGKQLSLGWQG